MQGGAGIGRTIDRRTFAWAAGLCALLLGGAVILSADARAAFPGQNGVIAYDTQQFDPDEDPPVLAEIAVIRPNGTGLSRRTFNAGGSVDRHDDPAFSGDGRRIVWEADEGDDEIWIMWANGAGKRRLTDNADEDRNPRLSPNGELIVFQRDVLPEEDPQIWIMRSDGSGQRRLTSGPGADTFPTFSPDGRTILFVSERSGAPEIWAIGVGGGNLRQLTEVGGGDVQFPDVAPGGRAFAFTINNDAWTMRMDGSGLKQWTDTGGRVNRPVFSPDGRWLAWAEFDAAGGSDQEIMRRRLAGGPPIQVTDNEWHDDSPNWQPLNRCAGRRATIVGSIRRDVIVGTPRADVIVAHAGNDLVRGLRGNDRICGRAGRDRLHGHAGRDRMFGQAGNDWLFGGRHRDRLFGGRGFDRLFGGPAFDLLRGGPGRDIQRQ